MRAERLARARDGANAGSMVSRVGQLRPGKEDEYWRNSRCKDCRFNLLSLSLRKCSDVLPV